MLKKERLHTINRILTSLELKGYDKTRRETKELWTGMFRNVPIGMTLEQSNISENSIIHYEYGILDSLYYQRVRLSLYKKIKTFILNKLHLYITSQNWKKLESTKKENLSDFLKAIGNKEKLNRNLKFKRQYR